jgi:hypothetical protein
MSEQPGGAPPMVVPLTAEHDSTTRPFVTVLQTDNMAGRHWTGAKSI